MLSRIRAALLCLFLASPAFAAPAEPAWLRDGSLAFEQLLGDQAADFEAMDQAFIDAQARAPDDVALAIAHCDLFWLVWDLEGAAWSEVAPDRHGNCLASLEERMPDAPEVLDFVNSNALDALAQYPDVENFLHDINKFKDDHGHHHHGHDHHHEHHGHDHHHDHDEEHRATLEAALPMVTARMASLPSLLEG